MSETGSDIQLAHDYFPSDFSSSTSQTYELGALIDYTRFICGICHPKSKQWEGIRVYSTQSSKDLFSLSHHFPKVIEKLHLQQSQIQLSNLLLTNTPFTLVPENYYKSGKAKAYQIFQNGNNSTSELQENYLSQTGAYILYSSPPAIQKWIKNQQSSPNLYYGGTCFLEGLTHTYPQSDTKVYTQVWQQNLYVAVFEKGKCLFFNSFDYQTSKDFIYYILAVYDQLELNPESVPLTIYGELNKNSAIHKMVKKYIRSVEWGTLANMVNIKPAIEKEIPEHVYFTLMSSTLCES